MYVTDVNSIADVVKQDLCIGCGVCAVNNPKLRMEINEQGFYRPIGNLESKQSNICPFSNASSKESDLGQALYSQENQYNDQIIGYYDNLYVGAVREQSERLKSSSGGLATWFAKELLNSGEIDYFIGVGEVKDVDGIYSYGYTVAESCSDIDNLRKTKYYPVELSEVLDFVREHEGRYAIIGVPCFIKAIRLLQENDELMRNRISCCIAIVCGHFKSSNYYEMILQQLKVGVREVEFFDFRTKFQGTDAHDYGVTVRTDKNEKSMKAREIFGTNWDYCFQKYKACDFCDDVFGETADVVLGDAWVSEYDQDWRGHNLVISRQKKLSTLLERGVNEGSVIVDSVAPDLIKRSQGGSIRHKRVMIGFRVMLLRLFSRKNLTKRSDFPEQIAIDSYVKTMKRMDLRRMSVSWFWKVKNKENTHEAFVHHLRSHIKFWDNISVALGLFRKVVRYILKRT